MRSDWQRAENAACATTNVSKKATERRREISSSRNRGITNKKCSKRNKESKKRKKNVRKRKKSVGVARQAAEFTTTKIHYFLTLKTNRYY